MSQLLNTSNVHFIERFRWYPVRWHLAAGVAATTTWSGRERCTIGRDGWS